MRVLLVKTSSMGDIIHALPALTDAASALPGIQFDWVVETAFAEIPAWHPAVDRVIPVAIRRWRKQLLTRETFNASRAFYKALRAREYAAVVDAQGLLKSALIAKLARGISYGPDRRSARDPFAALFYQRGMSVPFEQHAVDRARQLLAGALGYALPKTAPDYGIDRKRLAGSGPEEAYLVFLHGTTWETKLWPLAHWQGLAKIVLGQGYRIRLPWGTPEERARAQQITEAGREVEVLPAMDLAGMASVLAGAKGIVSVDTGFGHLAAALAVPAVSLYGPTSPELNGAMGPSQVHLAGTLPCVPCFGRQCALPQKANETLQPPCLGGISPEQVWATLEPLMA